MSKLSKEAKAQQKAFLKSVKGIKKAEFDAADIFAVSSANDDQSLISALQFIANHSEDNRRSHNVQMTAEKSLHALGQPTAKDLIKYQQLVAKMEAPDNFNDQQSISDNKETVLNLADTLVQINFMKQKFPAIDSLARQPAPQAEQPAPQAAKPPRPAGPPPGQATAAEQTVPVSQPKLKTTPNNAHSVIIGDIFTQLGNPAEKEKWPIIVDPAHEKTMNGKGGMSGAIKAFYEKNGKKKEYIRDLLKFPKENGLRCPNGQVRRTSTDGVEILHTSAPDLRSKKNVNKDGTPTEDAQQKLYQAYYNTFKAAAELNQQNSSQRALSCPILGAGIFKWPMELSTEIAGKALQQFRQDNGNDLQVNFYVHPSALKADQTPQELETNLSSSIQEGIDDANIDKAHIGKHINQKNTTGVSSISEEKLKDKTIMSDLVTKLNSLKDSYAIYKPLAKELQSLLEKGLSESDMAKQAVALIEQTFDKIANYDEREFDKPEVSKARMKNVIIANIDLLYDEKLNADKTNERKVRFAEETPLPAESEPTIDAPVTPKRSGRPLPAIPTAALRADTVEPNKPPVQKPDIGKEKDDRFNDLYQDLESSQEEINDEDYAYLTEQTETHKSRIEQKTTRFAEEAETGQPNKPPVQKPDIGKEKDDRFNDLYQDLESSQEEINDEDYAYLTEQTETHKSRIDQKATQSSPLASGPAQTQPTPLALNVNIQALYNIERENTHKEKSLFHSFARNVVSEMGKLKANSVRENQITGLQALVDNYNKAPSSDRSHEALQLYTALQYVKYEIGRENNKFSSSLGLVCDNVLNKIPKPERDAIEKHFKEVSPNNITGAINATGQAAIKQSDPKPSESSSNKQRH